MDFTEKQLAAFQVPWGYYLLLRLRHRTRGLWRWLGDLESNSLRDELDQIPIERPIYIAGLARSGSTMLLEIVASHPDVITHRYADFWTIFTPVWCHHEASPRRTRPRTPVERSHGDGLMVTADSPEAMEEVLWMSFFERLHDWRSSNVLDEQTVHPAFESFYRDHLRKLLMVRKGRRYAAKGNYNLARLAFLLRLFPDARFVVPIRHPRSHIASLQKQHALFRRAAARYPRSVAYLDQVGHFEFGADRRPVNYGDDELVRSIVDLWRHGDEVRGWARYWTHTYGTFFDLLKQHPGLQQAVLVLRYEDLCADPEPSLARILDHCGLDCGASVIGRFAGRLHVPTYYVPAFTPAQEEAIEEETHAVAGWAGYAEPHSKLAGSRA